MGMNWHLPCALLGVKANRLRNNRHALLTIERALSSFGLGLEDKNDKFLREILKAQVKDCQALAVHGEFSLWPHRSADRCKPWADPIWNRATQAAFSPWWRFCFLPPTLVASVYGMNFANLPGIANPYGYHIATGLMIGSALGTYLYCKWQKWL